MKHIAESVLKMERQAGLEVDVEREFLGSLDERLRLPEVGQADEVGRKRRAIERKR